MNDRGMIKRKRIVAVDASKRANRALAKLRRWVHETAGGMTKVVELYNKKTGGNTKRQQLERVFKQDEKSRVEPRFGTGIVLMEIQKELCK